MKGNIMKNVNASKKTHRFGVIVLLAVLVTVFALSLQIADAHKGHAGPMVTFMKKKTALKAMLPAGARLVKRKQPLPDAAATWAKETFAVELETDRHSYYLASDKKSKDVMGASYIVKVGYRHGDIKLAVGIDDKQHITQVAIMGLNEKYVVDFDGNVGTGLIADYAGLSLQELVGKAKSLESSDKATREFAKAVRDAAVLLEAFIYSVREL